MLGQMTLMTAILQPATPNHKQSTTELHWFGRRKTLAQSSLNAS